MNESVDFDLSADSAEEQPEVDFDLSKPTQAKAPEVDFDLSKPKQPGVLTRIWNWTKEKAEADYKRKQANPIREGLRDAKDLLVAAVPGVSGLHYGADLVETGANAARWLRDKAVDTGLRMAVGEEPTPPKSEQNLKSFLPPLSDYKNGLIKPESKAMVKPPSITSDQSRQVLKNMGLPPWMVDAPDKVAHGAKSFKDLLISPDTIPGQAAGLAVQTQEMLAPAQGIKALGLAPKLITPFYYGAHGSSNAYGRAADTGKTVEVADKYAKGQGLIDTAMGALPMSTAGEGGLKKVFGKVLPNTAPAWLHEVLAKAGVLLPETEVMLMAQNSLERNSGMDPTRNTFDQSAFPETLVTVAGAKLAGAATERGHVDPTLRYSKDPAGTLIPKPNIVRGPEQNYEWRSAEQQRRGEAVANVLKAKQVLGANAVDPKTAEIMQEHLDQLAANWQDQQKGRPLSFPERGLDVPDYGDPALNRRMKYNLQAIQDKGNLLIAQAVAKGEPPPEINPFQSGRSVLDYYGDTPPPTSGGGKTTATSEKARSYFAWMGDNGQRIVGNLLGKRVASVPVAGGEGGILKRTTLNKVLEPLVEQHKTADEMLQGKLGDLTDDIHGQVVKDATETVKRHSKIVDGIEAEAEKLHDLWEAQNKQDSTADPLTPLNPEYQTARAMAHTTAKSLVSEAQREIAALETKIAKTKYGSGEPWEKSEAVGLDPDAPDIPTDRATTLKHLQEAKTAAEQKLEALKEHLERVSQLPGLPSAKDETAVSRRITADDISTIEEARSRAHNAHLDAVREAQAAGGLQAKLAAARAAQMGLAQDPATLMLLQQMAKTQETLGHYADRYAGDARDLWTDSDNNVYSRGHATTREAENASGHTYSKDSLMNDLNKSIQLASANANIQHQRMIGEKHGKTEAQLNELSKNDPKVREGFEKLDQNARIRFPELRELQFPVDIVNELNRQAASQTKTLDPKTGKLVRAKNTLAAANDFAISTMFRLFPLGHSKNEIVHLLDTVGGSPIETLFQLAKAGNDIHAIDSGDLTPEVEAKLRAGMGLMHRRGVIGEWNDLVGRDPNNPDQGMDEPHNWGNATSNKYTWEPSTRYQTTSKSVLAKEMFGKDYLQLTKEQQVAVNQKGAETLPDYFLAKGDRGAADMYRSEGARTLGNFNPYTSQKWKAAAQGVRGLAEGDPHAMKGAAALAVLYALKKEFADPALQGITGNDRAEMGLGGPFGIFEAAKLALEGRKTEAIAKTAGEAWHPTLVQSLYDPIMGKVNARYNEKEMWNPADDYLLKQKWEEGDMNAVRHILAIQGREAATTMARAGLFGMVPATRGLTGDMDPIESILRAQGLLKSTPLDELIAAAMANRNKSNPRLAIGQDFIPPPRPR